MHTPQAGHSRENSLSPGCGAALVFLVAFGTVFAFVGQRVYWLAVVVGVVMAVVVYRTMKQRAGARANALRGDEERAAAERQRVLAVEKLRAGVAIAEHAAALRTKRAQLRRPDEYGIVDEDPWLEHRCYFVDHVLRRQFPHWDQLTEDALLQLIDEVLDDPLTEFGTSPTGEVNNMDGMAYEHHCADVLAAHGWTATLTKASGDQGVDVIARRGHIKVALQCKRYAAPVGNRAVQEVIAARQFEDATHAVVVSTATYTNSARALAHKARVLLISDTQLPELWTMIISGA